MRQIHHPKDVLDKTTVIHDIQQRNALLLRLSQPHRPTILSFINQHALVLAYEKEAFLGHLMKSEAILRDGIGMGACLRLLGTHPGQNCNGTDFIPELLRFLAGSRIAVFGTRDPWLSSASRAIEGYGLSVVAYADGFRSDPAYVELAKRSQPDVILLGMGMPRQEAVAVQLKERYDRPCLIINGGAVLDFLGGRFPRAPQWVRTLRAEWVFRLLMEPRRLFHRYITGGMVFVMRVMSLAAYERYDCSPSPGGMKDDRTHSPRITPPYSAGGRVVSRKGWAGKTPMTRSSREK